MEPAPFDSSDLERRLSDLKNSIGAFYLMKKDLKRHWERSMQKYWELRKTTPATQAISPPHHACSVPASDVRETVRN